MLRLITHTIECLADARTLHTGFMLRISLSGEYFDAASVDTQAKLYFGFSEHRFRRATYFDLIAALLPREAFPRRCAITYR